MLQKEVPSTLISTIFPQTDFGRFELVATLLLTCNVAFAFKFLLSTALKCWRKLSIIDDKVMCCDAVMFKRFIGHALSNASQAQKQI